MADIFDTLTAADETAAVPASTAEQLSNIDGEAGQGYTRRPVKEAVQELLKYGLIEMARKPNLYQILLSQTALVAEILEPLDLAMRIDDIRGLAFVRVAPQLFGSEDQNSSVEDDEWAHPLVRRQRLNMEQSLLVALLRQQFVAHELEAGIGASNAVVALEDLLPPLQSFLGDLGSDSREQTRLRNLLDKLKLHGIVSEIDKHEQVIIRPIIAHVANPENLANLLQVFRQQAQANRDAVDSD